MIWSDIATWVGPTANRTAGGMANPPRGLVLHIASGFYEGTLSWQKHTSGSDRTSSHFVVARDGRCAQMVDTADASWAQKSGNGTWLSIELEGFAPEDGLHATHPGWETATPQQIEVCARLLAKAHQVYGVPLQLATSPSGRGLGHHSMGAESGVDWGHSLCPGTAIKGQKPAILARAVAMTNGDDMDQREHEQNANADTYLWKTVMLQDQVDGILSGGKSGTVPNLLVQAIKRMDANLATLVARPVLDVAALAAGLAPLLTDHLGVEVSADQLVTALNSDAGQAALVKAANTAEDS